MQSLRIHTTSHACAEECLLTISNNSDNPTQKMLISRIDIDPFYPVTNAAWGKMNLVRVASPTLLEPDTNDRITPVKNSTATSSLPSQVVISRNASLAGTQSLFRSLLVQPLIGTQGSTQALGLKGLGDFGTTRGLPGTATIFGGVHGGTVVQTITIRDGESFMICPLNETSLYPSTYFLSALLKVSGGGTFSIMDEFTPSRGASGTVTDSGFVIHNGSGSGVDLELMNLELFDMGQTSLTATTDLPYVRIVKSDAVYGSGQVLTPAQHSAGNPIPSALVVRRNTRESPLTINPISKNGVNIYMDLGYPNTTANYPLVRRVNTLRTLFPTAIPLATVGVNNIFSPFLDKDMVYGFQTKDSKIQPITLLAGEHLAIVQYSHTVFAKYRVDLTILHQPPFEPFTGHS